MEPDAPIVLGDFTLERRIGRGGMAEVWLGRHRTLDRPAALKVMRGQLAADAAFVDGFHREVRAVAGLDHPGIVGVFDTGTVDTEAARVSGGVVSAGSPWLAMEYAAGGDLSAWPLPLTWSRLHGVLLEILDALAHAHARGVIHRDLKPANILVRDAHGGRRLMLTDFGIAHVVEPSLDSDAVGATSSGTPHYMSPEQIRGHWRDYGPWSDLYALGCLAYELACGRPPYDGRSPVAIAMQQVSAPVPALGPTRGAPASFEGWVRRLMAKNPEARYECAADAAWALARMPAARSADFIRPSVGAGDRALLDTAPRVTSPATAMGTLAVLIDTAMLEAMLPDTGAPKALPDPPVGPERVVPPMPPTWRMPDGVDTAHRALGTGLFAVRETPFVGREAERDRLWAALRRAREGRRTAMVLLEGPAGSGKTRLADWLIRRAEEVGSAIGLRVAHGPVQSPLDGVLAAMRSWFRGDELARPALRARIEERLRRLMPFLPAAGLAEAAEGLSAMLDPAPDAPGRARDPVELRVGIAHWLRQATDRRPLLLRIDEAHFGLDSLLLAEHLLADRRQTPILIVATLRPDRLDERPAEAEVCARLRARGDVDALEVGPLAAADHARYVQSLLALEPALSGALCAGTGGDPWFAEQVLADWIERDRLAPGPEGYRGVGGPPAVPPDVETLVRARLDRFAAGFEDATRAAEALMAAATLGHSVERGEWQRLCAAVAGAPPPGLVDALADRGWVRLAPTGFGFTPDAWRDGLVERARAAGRWAALNRAAAEVLRADPPSVVGWERIARHHAEADEPAAAAEAWAEAAAARLECGDYRRTLIDGGRVEEAADRAGLDPLHLVRARALWLRADALRFTGRFAEAEAALGRLAACPDPAAQAEWHRIRGGVVHIQGDLIGARALYAEAARRHALRGDSLGEVRSLHGGAWVELTLGEYDEATARFERAAEIARADGHALDEAWCRHGMASALIFQGLPGAEAQARRALATFERLGARAGEAAARMFVGDARGFAGDFEAARVHYAAAIEQWEALGSNFTALGWTGFGLTCLDAGWGDEAIDAFARAAAQPGGVPPAFEVLHAVGAGLAAARRGDLGPWRASTRRLPRRGLTPPRLRRHLAELAERCEAAGEAEAARRTWDWAAVAWRARDPEKAAQFAARAAG